MMTTDTPCQQSPLYAALELLERNLTSLNDTTGGLLVRLEPFCRPMPPCPPENRKPGKDCCVPASVTLKIQEAASRLRSLEQAIKEKVSLLDI